MPRAPAPRLPSIAVEDDNVKRSVSIPKELDAELAAYAEFYFTQTGKRPRSADDVMTGLLGAFLAADAGFQKWKRDASGKATTGSPATHARKPGAANTTTATEGATA